MALLGKEFAKYLFTKSPQKLLRVATNGQSQVVGVRHNPKEPNDYSNFPKSYIEREKEVIEWKNPEGGPQYPKKVIKNRNYNYTLGRPWEAEAKNANPRSERWTDPLVEPLKDWTIFRGDKVQILVGKDKGKQGIVNYIVKEMNWVIVEGLNCRYTYEGTTPDFPGILRKTEKPLTIGRDILLVDPTDNAPTTVEWRFTEEGEEVRVSTRSGRIIPIPVMEEETYDYKKKELYHEQPKDTTHKDLTEITFTPKLMTFEMEIMQEMGIKEDRVPNLNTYWY